jgi:hypothetical protein
MAVVCCDFDARLYGDYSEISLPLQPGGDDIVSYRVGGPGSLFRCAKSGPGSMARPAGKLVVVEPGSSEAGRVSRIPGAAIRGGGSSRGARLFAAPAAGCWQMTA